MKEPDYRRAHQQSANHPWRRKAFIPKVIDVVEAYEIERAVEKQDNKQYRRFMANFGNPLAGRRA